MNITKTIIFIGSLLLVFSSISQAQYNMSPTGALDPYNVYWNQNTGLVHEDYSTTKKIDAWAPVHIAVRSCELALPHMVSQKSENIIKEGGYQISLPQLEEELSVLEYLERLENDVFAITFNEFERSHFRLWYKSKGEIYLIKSSEVRSGAMMFALLRTDLPDCTIGRQEVLKRNSIE